VSGGARAPVFGEVWVEGWGDEDETGAGAVGFGGPWGVVVVDEGEDLFAGGVAEGDAFAGVVERACERAEDGIGVEVMRPEGEGGWSAGDDDALGRGEGGALGEGPCDAVGEGSAADVERGGRGVDEFDEFEVGGRGEGIAAGFVRGDGEWAVVEFGDAEETLLVAGGGRDSQGVDDNWPS
jgi:hypothetical protein